MLRDYKTYDPYSTVAQPVVYLSFEQQVQKFLESGESDFSAPSVDAYDFPDGNADFSKDLPESDLDIFDANCRSATAVEPQSNNVDNSNNDVNPESNE